MEEPGGLQSMGSQRVGHDWLHDFTMTECPGEQLECSWFFFFIFSFICLSIILLFCFVLDSSGTVFLISCYPIPQTIPLSPRLLRMHLCQTSPRPSWRWHQNHWQWHQQPAASWSFDWLLHDLQELVCVLLSQVDLPSCFWWGQAMEWNVPWNACLSTTSMISRCAREKSR